MKQQRRCVLYDRECIGCGECDRCDLDPEKICDNCMKCVLGDADFAAVSIDEILLPQEEAPSGKHYKIPHGENQSKRG